MHACTHVPRGNKMLVMDGVSRSEWWFLVQCGCGWDSAEGEGEGFVHARLSLGVFGECYKLFFSDVVDGEKHTWANWLIRSDVRSDSGTDY